jgi:hypothetical protein
MVRSPAPRHSMVPPRAPISSNRILIHLFRGSTTNANRFKNRFALKKPTVPPYDIELNAHAGPRAVAPTRRAAQAPEKSCPNSF